MTKQIGIVSACAHRLYLYRPELFDALRNEGYEITVFGPESEELGREWLSKHSLDYVCLGIGRRSIDPLAEIRARDLLADEIKKRGIGLLYSYGIRNAPLVNLAAKKAGVPCINTINGAGSLFISDGVKGELKRMLIQPYISMCLRYSSRVFFQNSDDRELFVSRHLVDETKCIQVCGSGVNTSRFPVYPLPEGRIFGYCSRLNPEKGIYEMLSAFSDVIKKYPDAFLRLAGELDGIDGTPAAEIMDELIKSGHAEYLGEISDVPGFQKSIGCFVFPSYREGLPRAVLEAMSCGRPVITTDVTGCKETVIDGYNGILVKVKDIPTLRDAMLSFCNGTVSAEEMGKNSRTLAEQKFNVYAVNRIIIDEIKKFY